MHDTDPFLQTFITFYVLDGKEKFHKSASWKILFLWNKVSGYVLMDRIHLSLCEESKVYYQTWIVQSSPLWIHFSLNTSDFLYFFSNQKDIEFVIPPTKPPTTTLYGPSVNCQPLRSPSRHPTSHSDSQGKGSEKSKQDENVVNRGWNFIADVLSATSTFKSSSESSRARARSRDSLPVHNNNNSLDIPTIKTR